MSQDVIVDYIPQGPTLVKFHESEMFFRGIMGPFGSAKSTACAMEILRRSQEQRPSTVTGQRRTRWAVVRNTFPELKTTTLKTWNQWCPAQYGKLTMDSPIRHYVNSTEIEMEVLFMALDKPDDVKKLLSLELTGAWLNEARECPKAILDGITGRVGRFPPMVEGGCTWSGVIADTNPPDDQSWWYKFSEEATPEGFEFFKQPGGSSPLAENLCNLPANYYKRLASGKDSDWVKVYVDGEYGYVSEGKAVYPMFRDRTHVPEDAVEPVPGLPLLLGADFGLTPCVAIGQKLPNGRWLIIDEFLTDNCGVIRFAELLTKYIAVNYKGFTVDGGWGDPAGMFKSQSDERTSIEIMNTHTPWKWLPAPSNSLAMRLECVKGVLNRLVDGDPGLTVSKKAKIIRKGFAGAYVYKLISTGDGTQTHVTPAKNMYSHPHDAVQYLLLGGGEHNVVMGRNRQKQRQTTHNVEGLDYNPLNGIQGSSKRKESEPPYLKRIRKDY